MGSDLSKAAIAGIIIGAALFLLLTYPCFVWLRKYLAYRREERDYRDIDDFEGMLYVGDAIRKSRGQLQRWRPASLRSNASMWIGRNRKVELFPDWLQHPIQMDDLESGSRPDSLVQIPGTAHTRGSERTYDGSDGMQTSALSEDMLGPWPLPLTSRVEPSASSAPDLDKPLPLLPPDGVHRYGRMTPRTAGTTAQHVPLDGFGKSIQERRRRSPLPRILVPPPFAASDVESGVETYSGHSDLVLVDSAIPPLLPPRVNPWRSLPSPPPTRTWAMRRILAEVTEDILKEQNFFIKRELLDLELLGHRPDN